MILLKLIKNSQVMYMQVVHFQPHTLFINRVGCSLCLQQCYSQTEEWIHPTDPPKTFGWLTSAKVELLKVSADEPSLLTGSSSSNRL